MGRYVPRLGTVVKRRLCESGNRQRKRPLHARSTLEISSIDLVRLQRENRMRHLKLSIKNRTAGMVRDGNGNNSKVACCVIRRGRNPQWAGRMADGQSNDLMESWNRLAGYSQPGCGQGGLVNQTRQTHLGTKSHDLRWEELWHDLPGCSKHGQMGPPVSPSGPPPLCANCMCSCTMSGYLGV